MTYAESLASSIAFRAKAATQPGNIMYEEMKRHRAERKRLDKLRERGTPEVYGPPNPYALRKTFRPPMKR